MKNIRLRLFLISAALCLIQVAYLKCQMSMTIVNSFPDWFYPVPIDTMRTTYAFPAIPTIPSAGGYTRDPTFHTWIYRLTADSDSDDGNGCNSPYSYWAAMNIDSTRIQAICSNSAGNTALLWNFNAGTFSAYNKRGLFTLCGSALGLREQDAIWSGNDPHVIYAITGSQIYSCNVDSGAPATLLKNLSAILPASHDLWQMSMSTDNDTFAGSKRDLNDGTIDGYWTWKRSTNTTLINVNTTPLDEVQLDKTGTWLVVKPGVVPPVNSPIESVINVNTSATYTLPWNSTYDAGGHSDNGTATMMNIGAWENCWELRSLTVASTPLHALCKGPTGTPGDFSGPGFDGSHTSMLANNEGWAVVSDEMPSGVPPAPFFMVGEIVQFSTDGTQNVRHVAHSFSVSDHVVYNDYPRANISRDGRFITYSSNWGRGVGGRVDVFIVAIRPAP